MRKRLLVAFLALAVGVSMAGLIPRGFDESEDEVEEIDEAVVLDVASDGDWDETPMLLPRISKADKWDMIRSTGQNPEDRRRVRRQRVRRARKSKRDILLTPWRLTHVLRRPEAPKTPTGPAIALPVASCPKRFDAVTRGYNGRTYVFSRERVYQTWHEDGLQQKASFLITELFPGGPRTVTAALTNSRSGVTILIENRTVYRFRWNKKHRRFQLAKNTPQELPRNITITPQTAFEWSDGNQVVLAGAHFIIYDAYWNLATFTGHTHRYFPNLPTDLLGIVYNGGDTVLMFTKNNALKVYSTKKFKVVQEYPLKISEFVGCLGT